MIQAKLVMTIEERYNLSGKEGVMDPRTRTYIALFWRMLPPGVRRYLFVGEDLCEVIVYVLIPDKSLLRDVGHAIEVTLAEADHCAGFDFVPIYPRHIQRRYTISLLHETLRFVPTDSER